MSLEGKIMKKKFLLLLTMTPLVSQTSELPYDSNYLSDEFPHPSAPSSFDPFTQSPAQDSFEDWKKQTLEESQYQLKLRAEYKKQQKRNPGPPRTVPISRSVPDQVPYALEKKQESTRGHRRQRSLSDPSLFESSTRESGLPDYTLISTHKSTDHLLFLANTELEESIQINRSLTELLQKELQEAATRHQQITLGAVSSSLPERGLLKKGLDLLRRRSKSDRRSDILKKQTQASARTEQSSREAIIPLVAQVLIIKDAMLKLQTKVLEAGEKSKEQHATLFQKSRKGSQEFDPRRRTQSIAITQGRRRKSSTGIHAAWEEK